MFKIGSCIAPLKNLVELFELLDRYQSEMIDFFWFLKYINKNFISSKDLDKLLQYIKNNMNIIEPENSCDDEIILKNTLNKRRRKYYG